MTSTAQFDRGVEGVESSSAAARLVRAHLFWVLLVALAGCLVSSPPPGDDDDTAGDDDDTAGDDDDTAGDDDDTAGDDDDTAGDDDDTAGDDDDSSSVEQVLGLGDEDLPCAQAQLTDLWIRQGFLDAGTSVVVEVDTVHASTTFDPVVGLALLDQFQGRATTVAQGDDQFDCRHPPAQFSCPRIEFEIQTSGPYGIQVGQGSAPQCAGKLAEYDVRLFVNQGPEEVLQLLHDDQ